jgi:hypothetical protein
MGRARRPMSVSILFASQGKSGSRVHHRRPIHGPMLGVHSATRFTKSRENGTIIIPDIAGFHWVHGRSTRSWSTFRTPHRWWRSVPWRPMRAHFCNQVDQVPNLDTPSLGIKGINVTAGMDDAHGNQVPLLSVKDNLVGGALGGASLLASLGDGASGNAISTSSPADGPQFSTAGLLSAATLQHRALAPGSLISLFGVNLDGATVQFDGIPAPILYDSSSQMNLQVPWELQVLGLPCTAVVDRRPRDCLDYVLHCYFLPDRAAVVTIHHSGWGETQVNSGN